MSEIGGESINLHSYKHTLSTESGESKNVYSIQQTMFRRVLSWSAVVAVAFGGKVDPRLMKELDGARGTKNIVLVKVYGDIKEVKKGDYLIGRIMKFGDVEKGHANKVRIQYSDKDGVPIWHLDKNKVATWLQEWVDEDCVYFHKTILK